MKTVDIKGKPYIEVNERLKHFRQYFAGFRLISCIHTLDDKICVIRASIQDPAGNEVATGIAREVNGSTYINKTSYVENCETSAWGRALGNFGIGIDTSVASAEEVETAILNQVSTPERKPAAYQKPTPKPTNKTIDPNDPVLKEAMKTAVEQSFIDYQDLHRDEMPEGKIFCEKYFKAEVWAAFKLLTLTQQKKMVWCLESVNKLAESILAVNCLTDIKVDPMA